MSCKTINIDLTNVPPVPIQIGVAGENSFRTITFDASKWGAGYPDATYTVVYRRSDGYLYPVLVNASADAIVWNPTGTDTAVSGNGQLEVRLLDGETIGKTIIMQTYVAPSLSGDESEPSTPAPDWVNDVADDADRAEAAVTHYPQIRNGYWWVWDVESGEWVNTGVKATGEGGGSAANAVLYTPQSLTDSQKAQSRTNVGAGTYSKPASGIPASDLASGVIPTVPQMATQTDMSDWTSGKTVDASAVKTVVSDKQNAPLEIPVTESGGTYSTTVTAEQIRAAKEHSVFVLGGIRIDATAWIPSFFDESDLLFGVVDSDLRIQVYASLRGDSVSVSVSSSVRLELPAVTADDNGKFLRVVSGAWAAETVSTWQGGSY